MAVKGVSEPALFGETLVTGKNRSFPVKEYREELGERVIDHSNAKKSLFRGEPVIVGSLARLNLGMSLSPKGAEAFRESRYRIMQKDIFANNLAQAVELIHAVEHALEIVNTLIDSGFYRELTPETKPRKGSGVSAIEAPRGVLIHSYAFDGRGLCCAADIVTPTSINQAAMEQDLLALARSMEGAEEQEMTSALERLVRAYDPCISCAVHLVKF
jgi:coenzyme F420-reducing hydrogenase alpha subunit